MTLTKQQVDKFKEENAKRWKTLRAEYNPVTGEGLKNRVRLEIPDFAIPVQWVPPAMLRNGFIRELVRCGSIQALLEEYPDDDIYKTTHDVELEIRRIRHKYDFAAWAFFCIWIKAKEGGRMRFKLNCAQLIVLEMCEELREKGVPIDIVIVKARQWGGSTFCIFYQAWLLFKWDKFHSFSVAAHVQTAAETIVKMLRRAMADYPAWDLGLPEDSSLHFAPAGKSGNSYVIKDDKDRPVFEAEIHIGSAEKPDTLRSKDITGVHYSEVGLYPDTPEKRAADLIADISGGILKKANTMQVMESTAKSADDYFHEVYTLAKKGESNYHPLFIGWQKIPHDTLPIEDIDEFIEWLYSNRDNIKPTGKWKMPGRYYWWLWTDCGATLEGINWYRYKELDFTTRAQMLNEAPSNDIEAFVAAGNHVFDVFQVAEMRKLCYAPYLVGRLISNDRRGREALQDIKFIESTNGDLKIWEEPDDTPVSNRYVVSVDIGGPNPTSDFHSVRVFDRLMMMEEFGGVPAVVAEMHYHCQRDQLAYDAARLAEWYNHALLVIESNTYEMRDKNREVSGDGSQYILDILGEMYTNLYARESKATSIEDTPAKQWGFHTGPDTKPKIVDLGRWAISRKGWIEPCENCMDEFAMYIEERNKFTAPPKKHDDELMATLIGLWVCYREMPLPKWIEKKKSTRATNTTTLATF